VTAQQLEGKKLRLMVGESDHFNGPPGDDGRLSTLAAAR
jgi:hypothetical protein